MLIRKESLPFITKEFMNSIYSKDIDIINNLYQLVLNYENNPNKKNKELIISESNYLFKYIEEHIKNREDKIGLNSSNNIIYKNENTLCLENIKSILTVFEKNGDITDIKNYLKIDVLQWLGNHIQKNLEYYILNEVN